MYISVCVYEDAGSLRMSRVLPTYMSIYNDNDNTMWISILCTYADMLLLYILCAYIYMVYNVVVYDECLESGWGRALYAMLLSSIHLWNVLVYSTIS